jgi:hypothetical protein
MNVRNIFQFDSTNHTQLKKSGHRTFLLVGVTEMTWQPEL